ncbi:MAG: recombinase XerC [Ruminococcaceae bacterium]|nr:recombinase XerC [Oscillospiraceae bacterium]
MAVLTLKSEEYKKFPIVLKNYASHLKVISGNSEKTICEYLSDLRTFFRYYIMVQNGDDLSIDEFEKIDIGGITIEDVNSVSTELIVNFLAFVSSERNNNTTTRNRKLSSLRSFFNYMYNKKHLIDKNPAADIDSIKKSKTLPKYLTVDEAVRLLEAVNSDVESKTRQRDYTIIALFLNTGMRLSELVGLNLQSFDPELVSVKVLGKGSKERVIYLNAAARAAVRDYIKIRLDPRFIRTSDHAFFLSGRQTRISVKTVQWIIYKYLDLAGLGSKGLSVHKLRHTAATLMYQSGKVDIRVLKDILGHEQLNTTQIYTHVVDRNLEAAMDNNPLADVVLKKPKDISAEE